MSSCKQRRKNTSFQIEKVILSVAKQFDPIEIQTNQTKMQRNQVEERCQSAPKEQLMKKAGQDLRDIADSFRRSCRESNSINNQTTTTTTISTTKKSNIAVWLARFLFTLICGQITSNQQHYTTSRRSRTKPFDCQTSHIRNWGHNKV